MKDWILAEISLYLLEPFFEGSSNGVDEGKIALAVMISGDC